MKPHWRVLALALVCAVQACAASAGPARRPPGDPIAGVAGEELFARGMAYGRQGDLTRAEQYLGAALLKGYQRRETIVALLEVCVASSRLRAGVEYAEGYLLQHPEDGPLHYMVGHVHLALKNRQRARHHLRSASNAQRPVGRAALVLAEFEYGAGNAAAARDALRAYLAQRPAKALGFRARSLRDALSAKTSQARAESRP